MEQEEGGLVVVVEEGEGPDVADAELVEGEGVGVADGAPAVAVLLCGVGEGGLLGGGGALVEGEDDEGAVEDEGDGAAVEGVDGEGGGEAKREKPWVREGSFS